MKIKLKKSNVSKGAAWLHLEEEVAELYLELGANNVKHNINISGNQIDVYAEVPSFDGGNTRTIVSCKCYQKPVGVPDVREWIQITNILKQAQLVDAGVIVAPSGYTQDAHALASSSGIRLITLEQLRWVGCDFRPYLEKLTKIITETPVFKNRCYVPLDVEDDISGKSSDADSVIKKFLAETSGKLLIILGDFGAGKTTLMKHTFTKLAAEFLKNDSKRKLPIYVNLKDHPRHLNLPSLITDLLVNQHGARIPGFSSLRRLQDEGKMVLMFDAFDEMASRTDYQTTLKNFQAIEDLITEGGKVIITCRTHYFKDRSEIKTVYGGTALYKKSKDRDYKMVYVRGFSSEQIETFVKAVCGDKSTFYLKQIKSIYNLEGLAQRPILLDIITQVLPDIVKGGSTANSTTLYSMYADYWLKRDDWRVSLNNEERLNFTIAFACDVYARNASSFNSIDIERAIKQSWPESNKKELEHYLYDIRTCSFIRWEDRSGQYWFVHNSFMEFFVSKKLYQAVVRGDKTMFTAKKHSDGVLHFLSEHPQTEQITKTVKQWIKHSYSTPLLDNILALLSKWDSDILDCEFNNIQLSGTINSFRFKHCKWESIESASEFIACAWAKCSIISSVFKKGVFKNSQIETTEISKCDFEDYVFEAVIVNGVIFDSVIYNKVKFIGKFTKTRFEECKFIECDFTQITCSDVYFIECEFINCEFKKNNLDGVTFTEADFAKDCKWLGIRAPKKWKNPPAVLNSEGLTAKQKKEFQKWGFRLKVKTRAKKLKLSHPVASLTEEAKDSISVDLDK